MTLIDRDGMPHSPCRNMREFEEYLTKVDLWVRNAPVVDAVEISEKELVALMASAFALRNSKELKHGGMYVESIHDENSRRISFQEALVVLDNFIDRILERLDKE